MITTLSGRPGVGKTTMLWELLRQFENTRFLPSYTDRSPRKGEEERTEYVFVTPEIFANMAMQGEFLWKTKPYEALPHRYGTRVVDVRQALDDKKDEWVAILTLTSGVDVLRQFAKENSAAQFCTSLYLLSPSQQELYDRLTKRGDEAEKILSSIRGSEKWDEKACALQEELSLVFVEPQKSVQALRHAVVRAIRPPRRRAHQS